MDNRITVNDDELYHHGVQGQHWGVKNGPPYPLSRVGLGESMRIKKKKKLQAQNDKIRKKNSALRKKLREEAENKRLKDRQTELKKETKALKSGKVKQQKSKNQEKPVKISPNGLSKKDIKKMSDEDIKKYIDRLHLEKQLYNADNEMLSSGKKEIQKILANSGKKSLENVATAAMTGVGKMAVAKIISTVSQDEDLGKQIMGLKGEKKKKEGS